MKLTTAVTAFLFVVGVPGVVLGVIGVVGMFCTYQEPSMKVEVHDEDGKVSSKFIGKAYITKPDGTMVEWTSEEEAKIPACSPDLPPHTTCAPTPEQQAAEQAARQRIHDAKTPEERAKAEKDWENEEWLSCPRPSKRTST